MNTHADQSKYSADGRVRTADGQPWLDINHRQVRSTVRPFGARLRESPMVPHGNEATTFRNRKRLAMVARMNASHRASFAVEVLKLSKGPRLI